MLKKICLVVVIMFCLGSILAPSLTGLQTVADNTFDEIFSQTGDISQEKIDLSCSVESLPENYENHLFNKYWAKGYSGYNLSESASGLAVADEGYIVVGNIYYDTETSDFFIMRINENGEIIRYIKYDPGDTQIKVNDVVAVEDAAGKYEHVIVGESVTDGDVFAMRINGSDGVVWAYLYDHWADDEGNAVAVFSMASDDRFVIAGLTATASGSQEPQGLLFSIDAAGVVIGAAYYSYEFGLVFTDVLYRFSPGGNPSFVAVGHQGWSTGDSQAIVLSVATDFSINWMQGFEARFAGAFSYFDFFDSIVVVSDGGYLLVGSGSTSLSSTSYDMLVVKIDEDGVLEWANSYQYPEYTTNAYDVVEVPDVGYVITGRVYEYLNTHNMQLFVTLLEYDTGVVLSSRFLQKGKPVFSCNDPLRKAWGSDILLKDSSVVVAGTTSSSFNEEFWPNNVVVAKMSSEGYVRWGCCSDPFEFTVLDNVQAVDVSFEITAINLGQEGFQVSYKGTTADDIYICNDYLLVMAIDWPILGSLSIFNVLKFPVPAIAPNVVIIGPVTVEVSAETDEGTVGISHVDFMVDNVTQFVDDEPPYEWTWRDSVFGKQLLRVVVHDFMGGKKGVQLPVLKIF